jgi:putative ABC transport system permease protein
MNWWRRLWHRNRMEDELEKELRFHLDQATTELMAQGVDRRDAERQAQLSLGGFEQLKEYCRDVRGTRWLEDLIHDVRYALRTLRENLGFAAVALTMLALGISGATIMFTVINGVLLKPLPYPEPNRLVAVNGVISTFGEFWGFSNPDFSDVKRESRTLDVAAWTYGGGTISEPGNPEYLDGRQISFDLFSVLGIAPMHGRAFRPEEDRQGAAPVAIISYGLWQRRFRGEASAVGRHFTFEGKVYTVAGIAPPGLQLAGDVDVLTPLGQATEARMQNRAARFIHVVARVRPGVMLSEAQADLAVMSRRLAQEYPQTNAAIGLVARPLQQELVKDVRSTLWLLLAAVGVVLMIACANLASLLLARAISREREFAMRAALGAGRGRLTRQCLTESAVLGLGGGLLGVVLSTILVRPFVASWPGILPRAEEITLDRRVLFFAFAASIVSSLVFGLAPALQLPGRGVERALRVGARTIAGSSRRLHSVFVATEIALAVVLLVSAGMFAHTLITLSSLDPGVDVRNVLTARFPLSPTARAKPAQIGQSWQEVLERARRVPGIQSVALTDIVPMRVGENSIGYWTTAVPPPPNQAPIALASSVSPDYLKVMGIPLIRGRFIDEHDLIDSPPVVVIDDNLARRAFGETNPVGKQLWSPAFRRSPLLIVGVVGHVRHWGLAGDDRSHVRDQIYYPFAQVPPPMLPFFSSVMSIAVRTQVPPLNVVEPLRQELRGAAGDQSLYEVRTMEQLVGASLNRERFLLLLFGVFAVLAMLLSCIGVYGVVAYTTSRRIPELGVRMALGATAVKIITLVLGDSVAMIAAGVTGGTVAAWATGRLLERLVEGMRPPEVSTFAIVLAALVTAASVASFLPAWRASRLETTTALRQE